ncbi:MAG: ribokinase [Lachnospiraceae bacterium]|nr:ribokinase [Lachnospiraceae bacterium]
MKVLNFGSLNIDYVYRVQHIVRQGETEPAGELQLYCGGKGLNQSIAMAKAGVTVYHAGCVGEDGQILIDALRDAGVKTQYIRRVPGPSGHTIIQVDDEGNNAIMLFGGANQKITEEYVDAVLNDFDDEDIIVLQNEISCLAYIIEKAADRGIHIVLNPSPYDKVIEEQIDVNLVSTLFMNEVEGEQISGDSDPLNMTQTTQMMYPDMEIILTMGKAGSYYRNGADPIWQKAYRVEAVDTTGAGDTFTGYFVAGICQGLSAKENLKRAAKASALAVTRYGAGPSIPALAEVEAFDPAAV